MVQAFDHLLDATIEHLETLKSDGQSSVLMEDGSMELLRKMVHSAKHKPRTTVEQKFKPRKNPIPETRKLDARVSVAPSQAIELAQEEKDLIGCVEDWPDLAPDQKEVAMAKLRKQAEECQRCSHLVESRTQVVFGVGTVHTDLMLVGEAPGMD